jgi:hypothetical protein
MEYQKERQTFLRYLRDILRIADAFVMLMHAPGRARTCNPTIGSHVVEKQRIRDDATGIRGQGQLSGSQRRLRK